MLASRSAALWGGVAIAVAMGEAAGAADLPLAALVQPAPAATSPWGWTGFYIGAHGGYAWGRNRYSDDNITAAGVGVSGTVDPGGGFGGGQIGYNTYLTAHWVLGYEFDISGGDISQTGPSSGPPVSVTSKTDNFGTVRTRLGYAVDRWLLFGSAGTAWAHTTFTESSPTATLFSQDQYHVGWTAGAGVEYAVNRNWSVKAEYLYARLGGNQVSYAALQSTNLKLNIFQLDVNYRFDGSPQTASEPVYPIKASRLPVATPWSGSYLGAHGGYGWGRFDVADGTIAPPVNNSDLDPSGGFAGYQTGYNWRIGTSWVAGLESETSLGNLKDNGVASPRPDPVEIKLDWFGNERARLGFLATDSMLIYATGGFAWAHVKFNDTLPGGLPGTALDQFRVGWDAGGGLEYAFDPLWSAKVEYLHSDLGQYSDTRLLTPTLTGIRTAQLTTETVKLGINYHGDILHTLIDRFGVVLP